MHVRCIASYVKRGWRTENPNGPKSAEIRAKWISPKELWSYVLPKVDICGNITTDTTSIRCGNPKSAGNARNLSWTATWPRMTFGDRLVMVLWIWSVPNAWRRRLEDGLCRGISYACGATLLRKGGGSAA